MSQVWFTSDLHFGHENIGNFRRGVDDDQDNRRRISEEWIGAVKKRDVVWILGDAAFTDDGYKSLIDLPGRKKIALGNHDPFNIETYGQHFETVVGLHRYKKAWLSHAPIHPAELRGRKSLHGHVHYKSIELDSGALDDRYFNCCVENLWSTVGRAVISLDELRKLGVFE